MKFRTTVSGDQPLLLPPRPDEWLPAGHLARVVAEAVETLDLDFRTLIIQHFSTPIQPPTLDMHHFILIPVGRFRRTY